MTDRREVNIKVPVLARVEGEGALEINIQDGHIRDLQLRIFEPPRLFEKFLEGRSYNDVPDAVARICGICPVAYQMTALPALESAFNCQPEPWVYALRRVMYCGEWLQSHSLHIHLLAAPDLLGFGSAPEMAQVYGEEVRRGLRLQRIGNDLIGLLGGRSVHPVGVRVGGFHYIPDKAEIHAILDKLEEAEKDARALVSWVATLNLPADDQDFTSVALRHPELYPMEEGRLISSNGLDIGIDEYAEHFHEHQEPHSTALHSTLNGKPYLVGPLARMNLNWDRLPKAVQEAVNAAGFSFPSRNMFDSVMARAAEIYVAVLEAKRLLKEFQQPTSNHVPINVCAGEGFGCTEAPRGVLWQHYTVDEQGLIKSSRIVPPTSQNQARIEEDLRNSLEAFGLEHSDEALRLHGETVIRNYDPCISCATHFLRLHISR